MKAYQDLGIQKKMQLMTLVICGAVLLVAVVALFTFQLLNFRANFQRAGLIQALIIANNSTVAMSFKDELDANEVVGALKADPVVVSANLVLPDGAVLASYPPGKAENTNSLRQFAAPGAAEFLHGQMLVAQPVEHKGEMLGTLYLRTDYQRSFLNLVRFYGQVVFGVVLVSGSLGVYLSRRLSRTITNPVLQLARTAQIIGEKKDYSVRAVTGHHGDELGRLTESFNGMLDRIESQDAELSRSQQKLEALVHSIDGIVWERTPDTFQFTFISRQCESILGYAPQAWLEQSDFWARKIHPQDADKAVQTGHDLAAKGKVYGYEYRMIAADGRTVWIRESGMVLVENGHPVAVRGILLDITRQKLDEEQLDKLNRQLIDTSRSAGMAEVAIGVLHNVGNVLNSVSVSASHVGDRLRRFKIANLQRAVGMLREQNGQLGEFLTSDPKGKLLPEYLLTVAAQLSAEQKELIAQMDSVGQHIEHIKEIIAMQQNYAKVSGAYENLSTVELVEDAVSLNLAAFERHRIALVREFAENLPKVRVDRHKFVQIFINLLRNAKHAMQDVNERDRRLVIQVSQVSPHQVKMVVRDNGIGIPRENLNKIFNHGFTTKKDGHGFGLHSGANSAKEMGGSLLGHSEGPGQGAAFTLLLPVADTDRQPRPTPTEGNT